MFVFFFNLSLFVLAFPVFLFVRLFCLLPKNTCSKTLPSEHKNREDTILKVKHTVSVSNSLRENYSR